MKKLKGFILICCALHSISLFAYFSENSANHFDCAQASNVAVADSNNNSELLSQGFENDDVNFHMYAQNNPLRYTDPNGQTAFDPTEQAGAGYSFATAADAARAVLGQVNGYSTQNNVEVGGYISRNPNSGLYGYSGAIEGTRDSVNYSVPLSNLSGLYHTHAGYDPRYEGEVFSPRDIQNANMTGAASYLMTPSDRFQIYTPGSYYGGASCPGR